MTALRAGEARKAALPTERKGLAQFATVASLDRRRMERDLTALAADAREFLGRHPCEAPGCSKHCSSIGSIAHPYGSAPRSAIDLRAPYRTGAARGRNLFHQ